MIQSRNKPLTGQQLKGIRAQRSLMLESMRGLTGDKGKQGEQGLQGLTGVAGSVGKSGIDGSMGSVGDTGARGPAGPQGPTGPKGEAIKGDTGEAGEDGRGVVRVQIHGVNLIITYTDGEQINLGRVVGQQGQPGVRGRSGYAFGDTTTTNITEEVLSPEDSANLGTIADNSTVSLAKLSEMFIDQKSQIKEMTVELKYLRTHMSLITEEELNESDIEKDTSVL